MANQVEHRHNKKPAALLGPQEEHHPWKGSSARLVLQQLLESGQIPASGMTPKSIWETFCVVRPEFEGFHYKKFSARLRSMRAQVGSESRRSIVENAAFLHDQELFPVSTVTNRGKPRWEGSTAQRHLKCDVSEKKHERMTPQDLRKTREDYLEFELEVFRKHIHQEVRLRKFIAQYHGPRP
jgi:hypothetical protein